MKGDDQTDARGEAQSPFCFIICFFYVLTWPLQALFASNIAEHGADRVVINHTKTNWEQIKFTAFSLQTDLSLMHDSMHFAQLSREFFGKSVEKRRNVECWYADQITFDLLLSVGCHHPG